MRQPGRERIQALRHSGEKHVMDAIVIWDTLKTLQADDPITTPYGSNTVTIFGKHGLKKSMASQERTG